MWRNLAISGVTATLGVAVYNFMREPNWAEPVFNILVAVSIYFLFFRVIVPAAFTSLQRLSTEQMKSNFKEHPLGFFFGIGD